MIPNEIIDFISHSLDFKLLNTQSVSGGSINQAVKLSTNKGDFFLKWNRNAPDDFFKKEAEGLVHLRTAKSDLIIPEVFAVGQPKKKLPGFLLMEFIKEGSAGDSFQFGAELAKLHQTKTETFGLDEDNYIGSLPQKNHRHEHWDSFFIEERINPQLKMAVDSGKINVEILSNWGQLSSQLKDLLPPCEPSLLHGDLWSGNYLFNKDGKAVLIDPAIYYGHPEMDLAFSKMFGGFSKEFYDGYESVQPLEPGFDARIDIYNLYPLLVHVNLFGGGYTNQAVQFLKQF
ncbi:MAG: fructosamine kinase family protein [Balneolaceae bacterium]